MKNVITLHNPEDIEKIGLHYLTFIKRSLFVVEDKKIGTYTEVTKGIYTLDAVIPEPISTSGSAIVKMVSDSKGSILAVMYAKAYINGKEVDNLTYIYWRVGGIWKLKFKAFPKFMEPDCNYGTFMAMSRDGTTLFVGADNKINDETTKAPDSRGAVYTYAYNKAKDEYSNSQLIRPIEMVSGFGSKIVTDNDDYSLYKTVNISDKDGTVHKYVVDCVGNKMSWRHESESKKEPPVWIQKVVGFFGSALIM